MKYINQIDNKQKDAYAYISERIISGEYPQGMMLIERQLCDELQMSRTPIRGALNELAKGELVTYTPNIGMSVSIITKQDISEIFDLLCMLEPHSLSGFVAKASDEDITNMESFVQGMEHAITDGDIKKLEENDILFHSYYYKRTFNQRLINMISSMDKQLNRLLKYSFSDSQLNRYFLENHRLILNAIKEGDKKMAESCLKKHYQQMKQYYIDHFQEQEHREQNKND